VTGWRHAFNPEADRAAETCGSRFRAGLQLHDAERAIQQTIESDEGGIVKTIEMAGRGSVSTKMSDKLQFVAAPEKLKLVGHETDPVLKMG
jgi:hypothetical protein